ncbi:MAG: hypothetical protein RL148_2645 [Planctomycetota bacterium]|jgi:preprotein translocase subunit SecG
MSLALRVLLYLPVLLLVVVVVQSQRHEDAASTLRGSVGVAARWFGWSLALVALMFVLETVFID